MENLRVVFVMICRFVGEQMSLIFTRRAQNSDVDKIVQICFFENITLEEYYNYKIKNY